MALLTTVVGLDLTHVQVYSQKEGNFVIPLAQIKNSGGKPVATGDVKVGDKLQVKLNGAKAIVSASLLQAPKKPGMAPQPPPENHSFNHQNFDPPQMESPLNLNQIGEIDTILSLRISLELKTSLQLVFESFRYIPNGPNNMPLSLCASVFDYSVTYGELDLVQKMKSLIEENYEYAIAGSEACFEVLNTVIGIISSNQPVSSKLMQLQEVYQTYHYDLIKLVRNCIKIAAILSYHTKKYEVLTYVRELNDHSSLAENDCGTFESSDYKYLLDFLDLRVMMINGPALKFTPLSTGIKHIIYLLEEENGYKPIYTIEETALRTLDGSDYSQMLTFIKANENNNTKECDLEINKLTQETTEAKSKVIAAKKVYFMLNDTGDSSNMSADFAGLNEDDARTMRTVIEESICSQCNRAKITSEYKCGHCFCRNCAYNYLTPQNAHCIVCGVKSGLDALQVLE